MGVGRREALGVRQLAAALFFCTNSVPVPIWPHWIAPLIPMVSHALPRMQWALVGAKRLECGSLLPLSFCAQTTCPEPDRHGVQNNVAVPISHIPHQPDDRSCDAFGFRKSDRRTYTGWVRRRIAALLPTLWRKHRRSGARPSSAASQRDDRPYDPFGSRMCGSRTSTGWGCANNVPGTISV
ncbi:MAG: hypothetical protein GX456_05985 [Verrucomicrobia bacterium]|nr:hypothetical protein [Verrucomicrobiota bacterium]